MVTPTSNPLGYLGIDSSNPRDTFYRRRNPTSADLRPYKIGDRWINSSSSDAFILTSKTNNLAQWDFIGGGSGTLNTLTGSDAVPVLPLAGNITMGCISGLSLSSLGAGLMQFTNLRDFGPYVVSPVPGESEYSSIQTALNAASGTDGVVWVLPGTYVENITIPPSVSLVGVGAVISQARCIVSGNITLDALSTKSSVIGMAINAPGDAITCTGAGVISTFFSQCTITAGVRGLVATSAGGSQIIFEECQISAIIQGIDASSGHTIITSQSVVVGSNSMRGSGTAKFNCRYGVYTGNISLLDTAQLEMRHCSIRSFTFAGISLLSAGTTADVIHSEIDSIVASGFAVDGIGTLNKGSLLGLDTAVSVDPGVTVSNYTPI